MTAPAAAPAVDPFDAFAERMIVAMDRAGQKGMRNYGNQFATQPGIWDPFYGDAASGLKHDASGTPIAFGYSHGPEGSLSFPGVDPLVFHTHVGMRGLIPQIPARPSPDTNPTYQVWTGVTDENGTEPDGVCDDPIEAGLMKSGLLTSVFGRYSRSTTEIDITRVGQLVNRADPMDLSLVGSPLAQSGLFASGPATQQVPGDVLRSEVARKRWELAVAYQRLLNRQVWTGTPANSTAGGGAKEMTGLDLLVTTGHIDAETGVPLPSVDADVKDFDYLKVEDNGPALVEALTFLYYTRKTLAEQTGVMPVRFVFVIHPSTWHEISAVWPCSYLTSNCDIPELGVNGRVTLTGDAQIDLRDRMRRERFIPIEGDRVEVIIDDGIPRSTSTNDARVGEGEQATDVYLLPLSVAGGTASLQMEWFEGATNDVSQLIGAGAIIQREGAWLSTVRQTLWCIKIASIIQPRMILRTPWLSGRLDNVLTAPLQVERSPFPDDPYFVDGGNVSRPGPSLHNQWD